MVVFPGNLFSGDTEDPWGFLASIAKLQRSRFGETPGLKHKKVGSHPGRNCINPQPPLAHTWAREKFSSSLLFLFCSCILVGYLWIQNHQITCRLSMLEPSASCFRGSLLSSHAGTRESALSPVRRKPPPHKKQGHSSIPHTPEYCGPSLGLNAVAQQAGKHLDLGPT